MGHVLGVSKHSSDIKKYTAPGPRSVFDDPGSATVKPYKTPPCSELDRRLLAWVYISQIFASDVNGPNAVLINFE